MKCIYFLLLFLCSSPLVFARPIVEVPSEPVYFDGESLKDIADKNQVPFWALIVILANEKGKNGQAIKNSNGTWDLGLFQINTIHINTLAKLGIEPQAILTQPKVNAFVAGWLLKGHLEKEQDIWLAIGNYHSKTPILREKYIASAKSNLNFFINTPNSVNTLLNSINN